MSDELIKRLRTPMKSVTVQACFKERSEAANALSALQEQNRALREALENVMGHIDTPIARRRLRIRDPHPEWLIKARAATKQEGGE